MNIISIVVIVIVAFIAVVIAIDFSKRVESVNDNGVELVNNKVKTQRTETRIWLLTSSFVWLVGLVLSPFIILATAMGFTSRSSAEDPVSLVFYWILVLFPIVCLCSIVGAWILYNAKKDSAARLFSLLPLVNVILLFGILLVSFLWAFLSPSDTSTLTMHEQGNVMHTAKCALPVLDGGDGLSTTGCGVLAVSVIATGNTSSTSEAHNWQFYAQKGIQTTITIETDLSSCPQIRILDSSGNVIEGFKDENSHDLCKGGLTTTSYVYFNPPSNGTYILRLITPKTSGAYWLKIE